MSVHRKAVSRETYKVGMKNNTAITTSGTSAAGVPSLVSVRLSACSVPVEITHSTICVAINAFPNRIQNSEATTAT